jgi:hypothetical protein
MATTPTYGLRYPAITDPPNGAVQIQNAMTDTEAQLVRLDALIAPLPKGKVGEVKRGSSDAVGSTDTMMETVSVSVVAGRKYKISWSCIQSSSAAAGPPNPTVTLRSASGGSVTTAAAAIRSINIRAFNGTNEVCEFFATYDSLATETRTFGMSATSNSASITQTFQGGGGRVFLVEDIGLT